MDSVAKAITQCDNCKLAIDTKTDENKDAIKAKLDNAKGETQDYHFCNEDCLRGFLNKRASRRKIKRSKACLELDFTKKEMSFAGNCV